MDNSVLHHGRGNRASLPASEYPKAQLERLTRDLRDRVPAGEPSRDFFLKSLESLGGIKSGNVELRLKCLEFVCQYFYGAGDAAMTLRAVRLLEQLALKSGM